MKLQPNLKNLGSSFVEPLFVRWFESLSFKDEHDFDEGLSEFHYTWDNQVANFGFLQLAFYNAQNLKGGETNAQLFKNPRIKLLVKLCYQINELRHENHFYLSCIDVGRLLGVSAKTASKYLRFLVKKGVLRLVKKATFNSYGMRVATKYKYMLKGTKMGNFEEAQIRVIERETNRKEAKRFHSGKWKNLVNILWELKGIYKRKPFPLSARTVAKYFDIDPRDANKRIHLLIIKNIIKLAEKGRGTRPSTYYYIGHQN
ncbi:MAG: hypothetical protein ACTSQY_02745 [Candidatus Odinarchaeia archaeon]